MTVTVVNNGGGTWTITGAGGPVTVPFAVTVGTAQLYMSLPRIYRAADARYDWALLRYVALPGDQLDRILTLLDRFDYHAPGDGGTVGDTSALVDPAAADAAWLNWLGQHVGLPVAGRTEAELRLAIGAAGASSPVATRGAIVAAVQSLLTGSRFVAVLPGHTTNLTVGSRWDLLIQTRLTESAGTTPAAILAAILEAGAKPAGVVLHHDFFGASWARIMAVNPTLATLSGQTWAQIMSTT